MHIFDVKHRFMGGYALVGGPFPLAAGMAKAIQMKGGDEIAICFLGDAANNQGTFHESLNMAALWKLPVLYVCENNLYGIGTRIDRSTAVVDQYKRVSALQHPVGAGRRSGHREGVQGRAARRSSMCVPARARTSWS